jgi:uncharacterized phage-associated protein
MTILARCHRVATRPIDPVWLRALPHLQAHKRTDALVGVIGFTSFLASLSAGRESEGSQLVGAPPYSAETIAKWFVAWAQAEEDEISNLKLQKLLYYAQGHHLAESRGPLFNEGIEAWSHGPVVPGVWRTYKDFGSDSILLADADAFTWKDVDFATSEFLSRVWNTYGGFSAGRLRAMTHEERPWKLNFRAGDLGTAIPTRELESYFRQHAAAH